MKIEILIPVVSILLILSFIFKLLETAYQELNKAKIKQLISANKKNADKAFNISEKIDYYSIVLLIGKTASNIAIAVLMTDTLLRIFDDIGMALSLVISLIIITLFATITPRLIAIKHSELIAIKFVSFIKFFNVIFMPIILVVKLYQVILSKTFKLNDETTFTEDELLSIVDEAELEGSINENEGNLIRSVFDFDDLKVEDIFTPRVRVVAVSKTETKESIVKIFKKSGYSRLPVYEKDIDNIIGIINYKDFYNFVIPGKKTLDDIIKPSFVVTEYMKVSDLLQLLQENKAHMAVVSDEFGGTVGIVTMEDILEELVGEIWDEHDEIVEQIIKVDENTYKVKGNTEIEDLFEKLEIEEDETEDVDHITVNGFVLEKIGKIAKKDDSFIYKNMKFTVLSADQKKVLEVEVKIIEE